MALQKNGAIIFLLGKCKQMCAKCPIHDCNHYAHECSYRTNVVTGVQASVCGLVSRSWALHLSIVPLIHKPSSFSDF